MLNRVQQHRELSGLSRSELAEAIGVTQETVRRAEKGYTISLPVARRLANYFHTTVDRLFDAADTPEKAAV